MTEPTMKLGQGEAMTAAANPTRTHAMTKAVKPAGGGTRSLANEEICIDVQDFKLFYGEKRALHGINMKIPKRVTRPNSHITIRSVHIVARCGPVSN